jgi:hypothetical protein
MSLISEENDEIEEIIKDDENRDIMKIAVREAKIFEKSLKTEIDFKNLVESELKDERVNLSWEEKWEKYVTLCKDKRQNEILEEWGKGWEVVNNLKQEISDLQYERKHTLGVLSDTREKWYREHREHEISKKKIESLEKEVSRLKLNLEIKKESPRNNLIISSSKR